MNINELNQIEGLQFMPVREDKRPIHTEWQTTKKKYDFTGHKSIGLVCGKISGNIQAIDIDTKYDLTGTLFKDFCDTVKSIDPLLLKKLLVQQTKTGGYHLVFRCSALDGNQKLANRYTILEEKNATYAASYQKEYEKVKQSPEGKTEEQIVEHCKQVARNAAENDKVRVLFETRGDKGYIVVHPTDGYKLLQGSFANVPVITPEERATLFNVAYGFNEVLKEPVHRPVRQRKHVLGLTPIEDYNQRGDVVALLQKHGWEIKGQRGSKILMKRPGDTKADHSGNYDEDKNWFSVFSTSTDFEPQTPYQPYAVFAVLECGKDFNIVPKKLSELGYGDAPEVVKEINNSVPSIIDTSNEQDLDFLATEEDFNEYLQLWRTNKFIKGQTTGITELDKYFLFKEGNLVIINGLDNVGKSTVIWYLAMLSAMYNGWHWLIFSSENNVGSVVRKMVEFYWSEPIASMSELKYNKAKDFVLSHFEFIKSRDKLYNYQDILNMATLAMKRKKFKGLMIDPYNSLKMDRPAKSKQEGYEYHYEAASVIQLFAKQNNLSIYLNCHVGTAAARNKNAEGFTKAPQKEDTEMGVMFANKADDFLTLHRVTQHEKEWNITEIHVRKIKEIETGGKVTYEGKPVKLRSADGVSGFEYFGHNAVKEWHKGAAKRIVQPIDFTQPLSESELINKAMEEIKEEEKLPF